MENNITVNMENLSEDERNILLGLIEKANKLKSKVWKPKEEECYYFICSDGYVDHKSWYDSETEKERYLIGNCFKTKEEAEFAVEKLKVIAELKRFAEENNECEIDWYNNRQSKYSICLDYNGHDLFITNWYSNKYSGTAYFASKEVAEEAVKSIGEERLKKYYFEVED